MMLEGKSYLASRSLLSSCETEMPWVYRVCPTRGPQRQALARRCRGRKRLTNLVNMGNVSMSQRAINAGASSSNSVIFDLILTSLSCFQQCDLYEIPILLAADFNSTPDMAISALQFTLKEDFKATEIELITIFLTSADMLS